MHLHARHAVRQRLWPGRVAAQLIDARDSQPMVIRCVEVSSETGSGATPNFASGSHRFLRTACSASVKCSFTSAFTFFIASVATFPSVSASAAPRIASCCEIAMFRIIGPKIGRPSYDVLMPVNWVLESASATASAMPKFLRP